MYVLNCKNFFKNIAALCVQIVTCNDFTT